MGLAGLSRRASTWLSGHRYAAFGIIALGLLLVSPSLGTEPVADDLLHELLLRPDPGVDGLEPKTLDLFRFASGDPASTRALMNEGVFPWWTDPSVRLSFFRPLAGLSHWLDWHAFAGHAGWMHLHSLAWYAALLGAVALTYRRLAPAATAVLGLLFYAVDDAHAPTVGWIANRNAVIAVCFSLLALAAHAEWRSSGSASRCWRGPAWLGLGLLAGESALAGAAYLLAYALFVERAPLRTRALSLLGPLLVLLAWRVAYAQLGHGTSGSGVYLDPATSPLTFAAALAERVPVLLLAAVALPWSDFWEVYPLVASWARPAVWCFAVAVLAGLALSLRPLLRENTTARFWAAGTVLSAVPAAATFPHDRLLLAVTVGWMALLALALTTAVRSRGRELVLSTLVLIHGVVAPLLLPLRAAEVDQLSHWLWRSTREFPSSVALATSTVVLLNPPADPFAAYLPLYFEAQNRLRPRHFLWLTSGVSAVRVTRTEARTLTVRPAAGYLGHASQLMLRSATRPLPLGHTVRLDAATLQVTALTGDGRPAEVRVTFALELDDPRLLLMSWRGDRYVRFTPPRENEVVELPPSDLLRLLLSRAQSSDSRATRSNLTVCPSAGGATSV